MTSCVSWGKCEKISKSQANFTKNLYIQVGDNLLVVSGRIFSVDLPRYTVCTYVRVYECVCVCM